MQLEERQFILFDSRYSVEEIAELLYVVGGESVHFIRFAVQCRRISKVIICSLECIISVNSISSRV